MEWQTPSGWLSNYIQSIRQTIETQAPGIYILTSALLAAFKGIIHKNPSSWRKEHTTGTGRFGDVEPPHTNPSDQITP